MKVQILGSGAILSQKRNASSILLTEGKDLFLLDCGFGAFQRLKKEKIAWWKIKAIFITHPHSDHLADLIPFLQTLYVWTLYAKRQPKIYLFGYPGFKEDFQSLKKIMFPEKLIFPIEIKELKNSQIKFNGLKIYSRIVQHNNEFFTPIALKIKDKNKTLVYSGDTGFCQNLEILLKNADLAILENSNPFGSHNKYHLNAKEAAILAQRAKVKKLVLTHLFEFHNLKKIFKEAKEEFNGKIILAKDSLEIKI